MLRVYSDRSHYSPEHRGALNDIVKAFWNDGTLEQRRITYGNRPDLFEVTSSPEDAQVHLLTMRWPHYVALGREEQALRSVELARKLQRPIAIFSLGDFEANFPVAGHDIHVFEASGYRSRRHQTVHGMPPFFDDPLPAFCGGVVALREKRAQPSIGFCGQAGASLPLHAARLARNKAALLRWKLRRAKWEPPPLEHTWFRQRVLDTFSQSSSVTTNFVLRAKYRAGVPQAQNRNDPTDQSRREFVDNVLDTDYTLSVRGGGNFSVRFYEALALGRIPAFIDTDCALPFHDRIDWRRFAVWVDARDLSDAPAMVADFHARLSKSEFRERQLECRALWEQRLSPDGFYAHFHEHFPELEQP